MNKKFSVLILVLAIILCNTNIYAEDNEKYRNIDEKNINKISEKYSGYKDGIFYAEGEPANWWCDDGEAWYFFQNGKKHTGYGKDASGEKYFLNGKYGRGYYQGIFYAEGEPANWWYDDGEAWYFFQNGKKHTGYGKDASGEKYFLNGKYGRGYYQGLFYAEGELTNWWYDDGEAWYFFQNGKKFTGYGKDASGEKYFLNGKYGRGYYQGLFYAEGELANWWYDDGNAWYFFQGGKKYTGYGKDASGEKYFLNGKYGRGYYQGLFYAEGEPANWWYDDGDAWYFFKNGKKFTGYGKDASGTKYFLNGKYVRGYYQGLFYAEGEPANWWYDDGNAWYFFQDGKKYTGYGKDASGTKYFENGKYGNGWAEFSSKWKYFENGIEKKGWIDYRENRYYMGKDGYMVTGEVTINNEIYIFSSNGILIENRTKALKQNAMKYNNTKFVKSNSKKYVVDLSEHNGYVNFEKLKQNAYGAILRIGWGYFTLDKRFVENLQKAKKYNIPYGIYHYSYALNVSEALKEADNVIATLKRYNVNPSYPIYYDMEDADGYKARNGINIEKDHELMRSMVEAFCNKLQSAGYQVGVYASKYWFDKMGDLSDYHIWLAHWGVNAPTIPYVGLWQFTDDGDGEAVGTSSTYVDSNYAFFIPR